jgi:3-hydroxyacyl-CoA dehydrogenase
MPTEISSVGILGGGVMGSGIGQSLAVGRLKAIAAT